MALILTLSLAHWLLPAQADAQGAGIAFARITPTLLALGLVAFCVLLGEGAMADWSAVYLHSILGAGTGVAGLATRPSPLSWPWPEGWGIV